MKLITKRMRIKSAHEQLTGKGYDHIESRLSQINTDTCTEKEFNEAVGHPITDNFWTELICEECGIDVQAVVELGEEDRMYSRTVQICLDCLKKAAKMVKEKQ